MKMLICAFAASAIAGLAPQSAAAADLGYYYNGDESYVERRAPVIERERIVERRYYEPYDYDYADEPVVIYYRRGYRPYPYYAAAYPYRYDRYYHRRWRHGRW